MKAFIIIDVQNDFMPGGPLAVPGGEQIIPVINHLQTEFDCIIATQDWHPAHHKSFVSQHPGKSAFESIEYQGEMQTLWPEHCVQGSRGANFHPDLVLDKINAIIRKGMDEHVDSYSAFFDNRQQYSTGLAGFLRDKAVTDLYFSGLCADICVYASIKDALRLGFKCTLFEEATCALDKIQYAFLRETLLSQGVEFF